MRTPLARKEHSLDWGFKVGYEEDGGWVLSLLVSADGRLTTELAHLGGSDPVQQPASDQPPVSLSRDGRTATVTVELDSFRLLSTQSMRSGTPVRELQVTTSRAVQAESLMLFLSDTDTSSSAKTYRLGAEGCAH